MAQREREDAARQGRSAVLGPGRGSDVGPGVAVEPLSGKIVPAPAEEAGWLDAIAAAASQARGHAEQAAVTGIGPGTVEQPTADVARLSRAYVSAPPLPLFVAMHRALDHVEAALDQKVYPAQARDLNFLLVENFGNASPEVPMYNSEGAQIGVKFTVTSPLTGPSGATWDITSAWRIDWDGTVRLITATP